MWATGSRVGPPEMSGEPQFTHRNFLKKKLFELGGKNWCAENKWEGQVRGTARTTSGQGPGCQPEQSLLGESGSREAPKGTAGYSGHRKGHTPEASCSLVSGPPVSLHLAPVILGLAED